MAELLIIGGGKMGAALLGGLLRHGRDAQSIVVVEPLEPRRKELAEIYGVRVTAKIEPASATILATKPDIVPKVARQAAEIGTERLLSIAAGVTLATLDEATGGSLPVG